MVTKSKSGRPAKRPAESSPAHPAGRPEPPDWLSPEAVVIFNATCNQLASVGKLTDADASVIASFASLTVDHQRTRQLVDDAYSAGDVVIKSARGGQQTNPVFGLLDQLERRLAAVRKELGAMSPTSRERRAKPTPPASPEKSKILKFAAKAKARRERDSRPTATTNGTPEPLRPTGPQLG